MGVDSDEFKRNEFASKRDRLEEMFNNKKNSVPVNTTQYVDQSSTPVATRDEAPAAIVSPKVLSPEKLELLMESRNNYYNHHSKHASSSSAADGSKNSNFLRSALDRISNRASKSKSKSSSSSAAARSSSVPLRTLVNNGELDVLAVSPDDNQDELYPKEIDDLRRGKTT